MPSPTHGAPSRGVALVLGLVASIALASIGLFAFAQSAAQAEPHARSGCVTRAEYNKVKKGMTTARVHGIFGTKGKRLFLNPGQQSNEGREYLVCGHPRSTGSFVQVQYNNYATNGGPRRVVYKQMQVH